MFTGVVGVAGGGFASVGREMTLRNESGRTQTGAARTATETGRKGTTDPEVGEEVECQGPIDTAHAELVSDALFQTRHQSIVLFQY